MRQPAGYRIIDEPAPTGLEQIIVNPLWPLLGAMFGGGVLGYPWFVLNSFALGGKRRFRDLGIALGSLALSAAALVVIALLASRLVLDPRSLPYAQLAPVGIRLAAFYWLFMRQEQSYGLYTYFGGRSRNGVLVVAAGAFLGHRLLAEAPVFLRLLLG